MLNPRYHPHDGPDPGVPLWVVFLAALILSLAIVSSATSAQEAPPGEQLEMTLYAVVDDGGNTHSYGADGAVRRDPRAVGVLFREHADAVAVRDAWNREMPGYTAAVVSFTGRTGVPEFAAVEWWGWPIPPEVR